MRLRTGLRVVQLGPDEIQIGVDGRLAARIDSLAPHEVSVLLDADASRHLPDTPAGLDPARWGALLADLVAAGLTEDTQQILPRSGGPDAIAWGLLDPSCDGRARVEARSGRAVAVSGLGPTGLTVAAALAAAGVGTIMLDDDSTVRPVDVGTCGYRWSDVGARRAETAARVLRDTVPATAVDPDGVTPDVVVLVDADAADPVRASALVASDIAHVSVVLREVDALVGPLVVPGNGPCLHCLDLHRAQSDPRWPEVLARVTTSPRPPAETVVVAGIAGHLAAGVVLAFLDGDPTPTGLTWEVAVDDPAPRVRGWSPHPGCACGQLGAGRDVTTHRTFSRASAADHDLAWSRRPRPR